MTLSEHAKFSFLSKVFYAFVSRTFFGSSQSLLLSNVSALAGHCVNDFLSLFIYFAKLFAKVLAAACSPTTCDQQTNHYKPGMLLLHTKADNHTSILSLASLFLNFFKHPHIKSFSLPSLTQNSQHENISPLPNPLPFTKPATLRCTVN